LARHRGKLIAIEGIDQSGKRTQAQFLLNELRRKGYAASTRGFPDYTTPLGRQLMAYLTGRSRLDYHAVHLLYAANKWEKADELRREIKRGRSIIVNRYSPSNLAYGVGHGLSLEWLSSLEKGLPKPDVVIVLDISPRTSFRRKSRRRDVHEGDLAYLKKVRGAYLRLAKRYSWRVVDGEQDSKAVRRELWSVLSRCLRRL
jgi:dTMP kinase